MLAESRFTDARRLWMIGLDVARHADHPLGSDLAVYLLYDMALQAVHLGRFDEALRLVHLGHAAAAVPCPVSSSTTSCLANIQARAHAAQGDAAACDRALGQAVDTVTAVSSPRAYKRLRVLNTVLEPLHDSAGVAAFRDRLAATAA